MEDRVRLGTSEPHKKEHHVNKGILNRLLMLEDCQGISEQQECFQKCFFKKTFFILPKSTDHKTGELNISWEVFTRVGVCGMGLPGLSLATSHHLSPWMRSHQLPFYLTSI